ncbi:MAG: hypothetical protein JWR55_2630 [Aeromicrobium sp.]|nr:hypothetical protein [Aeromicrobium sp.]
MRFGYLLSLLGGYAVAIALAFVQYRRFVFVVQGNVLKTFSFKRDGAPRGR